MIVDVRNPERFFKTKQNWIGVGKENRKLLEEFEREKAAAGGELA